MTTPEAKVRDPVVKWAKGKGILHIRLSFRPGVRVGAPDDLFLLRRVAGARTGIPCFAEFKRPGKEPTAIQAARLEALREQGYHASWFDNADDAIAWLASIAAIRI